MKSNIIVIEHTSSSISESLKCIKIEYNNQSKDEDIHRWLISNKTILSAAHKIIIPVRLGTEDAQYMGLYIGLHIRLTKELEDVRLLPILFITDDSKEDSIEVALQNLNTIRQKTKGKVDIRSMINEGRKHCVISKMECKKKGLEFEQCSDYHTYGN
jgi:uncharacterized protein YktA (UPF0223 family)